jgi:phage head maturation protease
VPPEARTAVALPSFSRVATLVPASLDPVGRTIDVIWTTGAPVRRQGVWDDQPWIEELSLAPGAVDLSRLNAGASVLDSHQAQKGLRAILGAVEPDSARIEGDHGLARLRFSQRPDVADLVEDIKAGIIRSLSVSYDIDELNEVRAADRRTKALAVYRADRWTPKEISFVAVGADPGAQTRAESPHRCYVTRRTLAMADDPQDGETLTLPALAQTRAVERPGPPEPPKPPKPEEEEEEKENGEDEGEAPTARMLKAERRRVQEIREAVRAGGLPDTFADSFIERGTMIGDVARAVLQERAKAQPPVSRSIVEVRTDGLSRLRDGMLHALLLRIAPDQVAKATEKLPEAKRADLADAASEWQGRSLIELGRACFEARGIRMRGCGRMELAAYVLGLAHPPAMLREGPHGFITTSDFPTILATIGRTVLLAGYQAAPRTFQQWTRQGTLPDFRITNKVSVGLGPRLLEIPEHSEYKRGTLAATLAQAQLRKFGRILAFTREALINDDVDLFQRIPSFFGNAAATTESDIIYGILTGNPPLGDGQPLFSAAHRNLMTASTITPQSVALARQAMMNQLSIDGQFLAITPRFLIVGPQQELSALQFLAPISIVGQPTQIVPTAYQSLRLVVEPRITDASWYLAADPNQVDTIEYDYLEGAAGGGPTLETREGWDIDGQEYKARMEFAATPIDFRGLVKNPGVLPTGAMAQLPPSELEATTETSHSRRHS